MAAPMSASILPMKASRLAGAGMLFSGQFLFDRRDNFRAFRLDLRLESTHDFAIAANQELFEDPADGLGIVRGEELVERALSFSLHHHLGEHIERHAVILLTEL